jgi:hypothetical protein
MPGFLLDKRWPNVSLASFTIASLSDGLVTSNSIYIACPPSFPISSAICFSLFSRRAPRMTLASLLASNFAVASPMPDDAPVIITTLFLIVSVIADLLGIVRR